MKDDKNKEEKVLPGEKENLEERDSKSSDIPLSDMNGGRSKEHNAQED